MLRRLLGKVEDGRFGRALAGLQTGWQWECVVRRTERVEGLVLYDNKRYRISGTGWPSSGGVPAALRGAAATTQWHAGCCASTLRLRLWRGWPPRRRPAVSTGRCRSWARPGSVLGRQRNIVEHVVYSFTRKKVENKELSTSLSRMLRITAQ